MSNPVRRCEPNLTYHVKSRCIELKNLFEVRYVKKMAIKVIRQTQKVYRFNYVTFNIMDDHLHFIIQTVEGGESISRIMQYINARIAENYNKMMKRTGPFWNERFSDVIVEEQENPQKYLLWLIWHLSYNPVRAGICNDLRDYSYSSIMHYLVENFTSPVKITLHHYFLELGDTFAERVKQFLRYEEAYRKRIALIY